MKKKKGQRKVASCFNAERRERQAPRNRNRARGSRPISTKPHTNSPFHKSNDFCYISTSIGTMNTIIQAQLDRVETALNTLIESIASYNPSIPAANALLAADDDLNKGLKQLSTHQRNHARIQSLHSTIDQQNASITDTLTTLASTRADLLSTPSSLPQKDSRSVPYNELLDYAKRISRYTVPPTFRPTLPAAQPAPPPAVNGDTVAVEEGTEDVKEEKEGRGTASLEDLERKWLDPLTQIPFVPWVNDETIKRGALAEIQSLVEKGENPENVGAGWSEEGKGETMETGKNEEVVKREGGVSTDGGMGMQRRDEKPKVFGGLDLYDPDVDDD